ncbi:MAG: hypothetical protein CSA07_03990 [Bacteroidia bacterium]|nr:MAG: hypothetical protein CSA07_03990 [Bacteroidia bacterium]
MRLGISTKGSLGFFILAAMLFISGALSIHELTRMGREIRQLLNDSYGSVKYSQTMLSSLESQEDQILAMVADPKGERMHLEAYRSAEREFLQNLELAGANLTREEEGPLVDSIRSDYSALSLAALEFIQGGGRSLPLYLGSVQPRMRRVTRRVNALLVLNQQGLYQSSSILEDSAARALRPGLIIIGVGILFTLMFTYLVWQFYVRPVRQITESINTFIKFNRYSPVPMAARDELLDLREAVDRLAHYAQEQRPTSRRERA